MMTTFIDSEIKCNTAGEALLATWTPEFRAIEAELKIVAKDLMYWIVKPIHTDEDRKELSEFNHKIGNLMSERYAINLKTGYTAALDEYVRCFSTMSKYK